jgi:hypothetical protein
MQRQSRRPCRGRTSYPLRVCDVRFRTSVTGSGPGELFSCQWWWPVRAARTWTESWSGVTFANPETGYTIARIAPEGGGADLVTAAGPLLGAQIGEFLRLRGCWSTHPKYGRQFEVAPYATVLPTTADNPQAGTAAQSPILPK